MIICVDLRTKAPLLLYFHIFCTCNIIDCPSLDIHIWIYKSIYEHKADFYFNKVPLHAAVFPLFLDRTKYFAEVAIIYVEQTSESLLDDTRSVWMFWISCLLFQLCLLFFFCLWFTLHRRYTVKRLKTCNRSDILGLNLF